MANFSIPYTNPAEYTFNSDKIEVSGGIAKLKLQNSLQSFVEDFADDTDFTYDSDKAEFVGGKVQQKNQRPTDATFYASYNSDINGDWGNGALTGVDSGGASVSNGKLDLAHNDNRYVDYDAVGNADNIQTGCIRFKYIPNYNGYPSSNQFLFSLTKSEIETSNAIVLHHSIGGNFHLRMDKKDGYSIIDINFPTKSLTSGQEYELEINFDLISQELRFFIDGVQQSTVKTISGERDSNIGLLRIGNNYNDSYTSNFKINDFIIFSTVQHTSNYTPDWSNIEEYDYLASTVTLPEIEHTLPGDLTTFDSFVTVESGNPRYTIQIGRSGNYLYWNGSAWVTSDGSYAQANDEATFNANVGSLDVEDETYGQFKINFDNSNTQSYVDTLTANLYMDTGYPTDKPSIYKTNGDGVADIEEWISFVEILGGSNEGSVVYQLSDDGVTWLYWDGSIWNTAGVSNYNSSNVLNAHMLDFDASEDKIYVKAIFISDGEQQVELDLNEVGYVVNTAPSVYAGTNKVVVYNVATTPFSDCLFSDAEGNIVKAEWKEEGGVYAEISQGVYSTLLEAVQALEYTPTHSGNKTLYLKITDSYDAYTEDNLIVNVNRVIVPITIKDENGHSLPNVNFNPGDGSGASLKSSPFNHTYYIGSWTATGVKNRFKILSESVTISISTTGLDFEMEKSELDYEINITLPVLIAKGDSASIDCQINADITDFEVRCQIYDNDGNILKLANSDSGGSDNQIEMVNPSIGEFTIYITKDTTDNFKTNSYIEIEIEDTDGKVSTLYKDNFIFIEEDLTWVTP